MKYRGIPHLVECLYLNDPISTFNVNEIKESRSKLIYINDPRYLSDVDQYLSLGMDVISRFKYPDVTYEPYKLDVDLNIVHWSNVFTSDLPIFLCNYENMKVSYMNKTLAIYTPSYIGNLTYKGDLTFLGLINKYLN